MRRCVSWTAIQCLSWTLLGLLGVSSFAFGAVAAVTAGARGAGREVPSAAPSTVTANAVPASFREITAAFTAPPTTGGLGDALEVSRSTFSTTEPIEFNAVLFETGLAGTIADLQLFLFDPRGRLAAPGFFVTGVSAPANRTGFFVRVGPGLVPVGRLTWVMVIFDAFGNAFVTPFQAIEVQ